MNNLEIEQAIESDLEEILALQKLCYQSEAAIYNDYSIQPLVQDIASIRQEHIEGKIFKATFQKQVIGSVRTYEKNGTCFVGKLIVHPDFQNKGLGKKLLFHCEDEHKTCSRFELFTGYKSEKNLYLYDKLGYREFKRQKANNAPYLVFMEKLV